MSIADAYVDLHVDGDGFAAEVRRTVKSTNVDNDSSTLGDRIGERIGSRLLASMRKQFKGFPNALNDLFLDVGDIVGKIPSKIVLIGGAIVAVIPLITSLLSALTGAATALVGALAQATAAALPLAAGLGAIIQAAVVGKIAFANFGKAVGGDEKALKALSPVAREAAKAAQGLSKEWGGVQKAIQNNVFAGLAGPIKSLGETLFPVLQKGLSGTGTQINLLLKDLAGFATSTGFVTKFGQILKGNNAIFGQLRKAAVPILDGLLTLFRGLQPSALGLAKSIGGIAQRFQGWAVGITTSGRLNAIVERGLAIFKDLWALARNLGGVLANVFGAAAGPGAGLLKTLADSAGALKTLTSKASVKNGIAQWATDSINALKSVGEFFGKVLGPLGGVVGKLFDPNTLTTYMKVFGQIFDAIMPIVGVIRDVLGPVIEMIGQAFADLGPKIQPLFVALAPLLKGIGAVIGNIVKQVFEFVGIIAQVITPVIGFISNLIGPVIERFAPIIATIILAFTNWGSALVRLIPIVGKFISPIVSFAQWLIQRLGPVLGFIGGLVGRVFSLIGRVIGTYMRAVSTVVSKVWGAVKSAFSTAVNFIWGLIKGYVSLWLGVFRKIGEIAGIVGRAFSAVFNAVKTKGAEILTNIKTFVGNMIKPFSEAVGKMLTIGRNIVTGIWNGISGAAGWLKDKITQWVKDTLPGPVAKLLGISSPSKVFAEIGKWVVLGLGEGVEKNLGGLKKAANKLVATLEKWKERLRTLREDSKAYAAGVADSFRRIGDVASFSFTNDKGETIAPTFALIKDELTAAVTRAETFQKTMKRLQNLGLNKTTLDQLYQAGPEALENAVALASAGKDGVQEVNKLQAALNASGKKAGDQAAQKFYGAGIAAAEGMIKGLQKLKPQMVKVAEGLGDAVAKAVKKALGIKSPSKVMEAAGINTVRGFQKGVEGNAALATNAMAGIVLPPKTAGTATGASGYGDIYVTFDVDDLDKINKVKDFLDMVDGARVRQRQTYRSGQVAV